MNSHETHGTQQYLRGKRQLKRHQEVSGDVPTRFSQFLTILRNSGWIEEHYTPGYKNYLKNPTATYDVLCYYKNTAPQRQTHKPPRAVTLVQSDNSNISNIVSGNDGRSFADVTCYHWQEMGQYAGNCPLSTANTHAGSQSLQFWLTMPKKTTNIPENEITNLNWIMLEKCSTVSPIRKIDLFQYI